MKNIAAIVILFNPSESTVTNIKSYSNSVSIVYAIDNTEGIINEGLIDTIKQIKNLVYIKNNSNYGIAKSLNIGANLAKEKGMKYILTMDQDSYAENEMVDNLYNEIKKDKNIALISAKHIDPDIHSSSSVNTEQILEVLCTMTSGNLLNLEVFQKLNGFKEEFFIDYVDHEYCLRLKKHNFKVIQDNRVKLLHKLGKLEKKKFLFFNLYPTHHSPERLYYRTRNRFWVSTEFRTDFPEYVKSNYKNFLIELITILLAEKDRYKKIKMILRGFFDYKRNRFGKLN